MRAQTFIDILKFNPYHDRLGRFATANGATSFTYAPGKSKAHDNAIAREKERMKNLDKITAGTNKMASYIVEQNGITTGKKDAVKEIQQCFQTATLTGGMTWDAEKGKVVIRRGTLNDVKATAKRIMSNQEYEDQSTAQDYYDLHRTIKNTPISISEYDRANIPDWNNYRKQAFGNMTISNNGISIDSFYQELSSSYPHLFDSRTVTNPADQIMSINDTLRALKPQRYSLSGEDLNRAADDLALQMINGYVHAVKP